MAEDAYRAELIHTWRMKRLEETLAAIRQDCAVIDRDIAAILQSQYELGGLD